MVHLVRHLNTGIWLRRARVGTGLALGTPLALAVAGVGGGCLLSPGFRRQVKFWSRVVPGLAAYKWAGWRYADASDDEQAAIYQTLHQRFAPVALDLIIDLRGLFVKFGQVCSVRPELVPLAYRDAFRTLQSDVPSEPLHIVQGIIEAELGQPLADIFERFDADPCGAASIGQVHTARTYNGLEVCIKVQYPDVHWQFGVDIGCLRKLVSWTQPTSLKAFDEFAAQYTAELDYVQERAAIAECYEAIMPHFRDVVAVPQPIESLCTPRLLTMTHLPGPKFEEEARRQLLAVGIDLDRGRSVREMLKSGSSVAVSDGEISEGGLVDSQSSLTDGIRGQAGQLLLRWVGIDVSLKLVSSWLWLRGCVGMAAAKLVESAATVGILSERSMTWAAGAKRRWDTFSRHKQCIRWIDVLLEVHGHEVFQAALFNADPHPGNIIAMADGRLGLIDYGQCKRISQRERCTIADLVLAVADDAPAAEVASALRACGMVTENDNDEFMAKFARLLFGKLQPHHMQREWHHSLHRSDKIVEFPPCLIMLYRMATILRGLALTFRYNISVAEHWRTAAIGAVGAQGRV